MKIRNPILFVLIAILIFLNIADVVTTQFIVAGEANPIYILTGSLLPVYILKAAMCAYFVWLYRKNKYKSVYGYYSIILILVYFNLALAFAQFLNINAIMHPQVLQAASEATASEKVSNYFWIMNIIYFFPVIISYITFVLYEKSRVTIELMEKKKRKWFKCNQK